MDAIVRILLQKVLNELKRGIEVGKPFEMAICHVNRRLDYMFRSRYDLNFKDLLLKLSWEEQKALPDIVNFQSPFKKTHDELKISFFSSNWYFLFDQIVDMRQVLMAAKNLYPH